MAKNSITALINWQSDPLVANYFNLRIITKKYGADPEIGFSQNSN